MNSQLLARGNSRILFHPLSLQRLSALYRMHNDSHVGEAREHRTGHFESPCLAPYTYSRSYPVGSYLHRGKVGVPRYRLAPIHSPVSCSKWPQPRERHTDHARARWYQASIGETERAQCFELTPRILESRATSPAPVAAPLRLAGTRTRAANGLASQMWISIPRLWRSWTISTVPCRLRRSASSPVPLRGGESTHPSRLRDCGIARMEASIKPDGAGYYYDFALDDDSDGFVESRDSFKCVPN